MTVLLTSLLAAFVVGIAGGAHCLLMCGGISAAIVSGRQGAPVLPQALAAQLGRVFSYALAGGLVAWLSGTVLGAMANPRSHQVAMLLLGFAWMAMALKLAGWWRPSSANSGLGLRFWRLLQPLTRRVWPIRNPARAFAAGALWGWLPCGLSYSMLLVAAATADVGQAALVMLAFGLGTVPTLLLPALTAARLQRMAITPRLRQIAAVLMIGFGLYTALMPWWPGAGMHHH